MGELEALDSGEEKRRVEGQDTGEEGVGGGGGMGKEQRMKESRGGGGAKGG